jgi:hypothetical protein
MNCPARQAKGRFVEPTRWEERNYRETTTFLAERSSFERRTRLVSNRDRFRRYTAPARRHIGRNRAGRQRLWHPHDAPNQGVDDLPADQELARRAAAARPF